MTGWFANFVYIGLMLANLAAAAFLHWRSRALLRVTKREHAETIGHALEWYGESLRKALEAESPYDPVFSPDHERDARRHWAMRLAACRALSQRLNANGVEFLRLLPEEDDA